MKYLATMDFTYKGKVYLYEYLFEESWEKETIEYIFHEGNYSCDCNRALFLSRKYPEDQIEELDCGETIVMNNFTITDVE